MFNPRLYRAAMVPFLIAVAVCAFSLQARPAPLGSTLAPDAFNGARAFAELRRLGAQYPSRRPGSPGDEALAEHVAATLQGLGSTAGGGFAVHAVRSQGQTIDGTRTLETVIAQRPGSTGATPIVIVAHRDAASRSSLAELSGTAALLELARVFATRETKRSIILASTSGGSGGDAGAAGLTTLLRGQPDAAIVLGDVASARVRRPEVVPFSDSLGSSPLVLQRTAVDAITHETGSDPGVQSALGQLAHLMFPIAIGEEGVLQARGVPSVLVQASGEAGPAPSAHVSAERLEGLGRSVLSTVDALDVAPDVPRATQTGIALQRKTLPGWAVRLLVATLLLGPLVLLIDGLARLRRRGEPVGRWVLWTLACALPFLVCAVFAELLGALGVVEVPSVPVPARAMPFDGSAATAVVALALTFSLAWLLWALLLRSLRWRLVPDGEVAGLSVLLVMLGLCALVWLLNPFEAILIVPALHLWLLLASPELRPRRIGSIALLALGLVPLGLLIAFYARELGLGLGGVAWMATTLVAGMHVGFGGALLWSVGLGAATGAAMLVLSPSGTPSMPPPGQPAEITIRGPLSYAGPGSLGGTESALRR